MTSVTTMQQHHQHQQQHSSSSSSSSSSSPATAISLHPGKRVRDLDTSSHDTYEQHTLDADIEATVNNPQQQVSKRRRLGESFSSPSPTSTVGVDQLPATDDDSAQQLLDSAHQFDLTTHEEEMQTDELDERQLKEEPQQAHQQPALASPTPIPMPPYLPLFSPNLASPAPPAQRDNDTNGSAPPLILSSPTLSSSRTITASPPPLMAMSTSTLSPRINVKATPHSSSFPVSPMITKSTLSAANLANFNLANLNFANPFLPLFGFPLLAGMHTPLPTDFTSLLPSFLGIPIPPLLSLLPRTQEEMNTASLDPLIPLLPPDLLPMLEHSTSSDMSTSSSTSNATSSAVTLPASAASSPRSSATTPKSLAAATISPKSASPLTVPTSLFPSSSPFSSSPLPSVFASISPNPYFSSPPFPSSFSPLPFSASFPSHFSSTPFSSPSYNSSSSSSFMSTAAASSDSTAAVIAAYVAQQGKPMSMKPPPMKPLPSINVNAGPRRRGRPPSTPAGMAKVAEAARKQKEADLQLNVFSLLSQHLSPFGFPINLTRILAEKLTKRKYEQPAAVTKTEPIELPSTANTQIQLKPIEKEQTTQKVQSVNEESKQSAHISDADKPVPMMIDGDDEKVVGAKMDEEQKLDESKEEPPPLDGATSPSHADALDSTSQLSSSDKAAGENDALISDAAAALVTIPHSKKKRSTSQYTCEECDKSFSETYLLRKHAKTHAPRPFHCTHSGCGKSFVDGSKLKRHQLVHSGDRPFVCQFPGCDKRFSLDFNLKAHTRVHSGAKPFVCDVLSCRRPFSLPSNLKTHMKLHSDETIAATEVFNTSLLTVATSAHAENKQDQQRQMMMRDQQKQREQKQRDQHHQVQQAAQQAHAAVQAASQAAAQVVAAAAAQLELQREQHQQQLNQMILANHRHQQDLQAVAQSVLEAAVISVRGVQQQQQRELAAAAQDTQMLTDKQLLEEYNKSEQLVHLNSLLSDGQFEPTSLQLQLPSPMLGPQSTPFQHGSASPPFGASDSISLHQHQHQHTSMHDHDHSQHQHESHGHEHSDHSHQQHRGEHHLSHVMTHSPMLAPSPSIFPRSHAMLPQPHGHVHDQPPLLLPTPALQDDHLHSHHSHHTHVHHSQQFDMPTGAAASSYSILASIGGEHASYTNQHAHDHMQQGEDEYHHHHHHHHHHHSDDSQSLQLDHDHHHHDEQHHEHELHDPNQHPAIRSNAMPSVHDEHMDHHHRHASISGHSILTLDQPQS